MDFWVQFLVFAISKARFQNEKTRLRKSGVEYLYSTVNTRKNRSCYSLVCMRLYNDLGRVPPNVKIFLFFCGFFGVCCC